MAKSKNKNNIKITSIKKNSVAIKKGARVTTINKKINKPKKTIEAVEELKKEAVKETEIVKKPVNKNNNQKLMNRKNVVEKKDNIIKKEIVEKKENIDKKDNTEKKELTKEELIAQKKERNRKKYQNKQKKYQELQKNKDKKKIIVEDQLIDKEKKEEPIKEDTSDKEIKVEVIKEEDLVKKVKVEKDFAAKERERKEKRKANKKPIQITQTITTIKEISVTKINNVREKVNDENIPVGVTIEEKVKRSRRLIKESIVYAIILTIINIICILSIDYFNFLRLFDIKWLNVLVTILLSLIFNFFVAFMVDYFVTIIWLKHKRKKKVGEQDGNNRIIKEKYQKDIRNKEGE